MANNYVKHQYKHSTYTSHFILCKGLELNLNISGMTQSLNTLQQVKLIFQHTQPQLFNEHMLLQHVLLARETNIKLLVHHMIFKKGLKTHFRSPPLFSSLFWYQNVGNIV